MAQRLGLPPPQDTDVRPRWGTYSKELLTELYPGFSPDTFFRSWQAYEQEHPPECPAYQGARDTLQTLREEGKILALHTNRGEEEFLSARLLGAGIDPRWFHVIQTPMKGIPNKPHVRSLEAILDRF